MSHTTQQSGQSTPTSQQQQGGGAPVQQQQQGTPATPRFSDWASI